MLIHVTGPAGVRKPAVARWIRERYALHENDVIATPVPHPGPLIDLIVEVIGPRTEWPACPAPDFLFRIRLPEVILRSVYFDIDCNDPVVKEAFDREVGPDLDRRMLHFGIRPVVKGEKS